MKKKIVSIVLFLCFFAYGFAQNDELKVYDYWVHEADVSNILYEQLYSVAKGQTEERASYISGLRTDDSRRQYPEVAKGKIRKVLGAFPEKTPLNPVVTGKIKREGFTVEKLYLESRPGFYVTGALFLPEGKGKKPAILYCCGHSLEGFRSAGYQTSILNLVKKGFIVFAFDPVGQGERLQYFDTGGKPVFGATHEHSYPGSQLFVSGSSAANYFVWDGIRCIDYLMGRKEVDTQRIGITGRSGGGTQTAYIAALDDRIVAAAPECYITSFDKLLLSRGPQDAEQVLMYSIAEGFDLHDLIEARAPKPTLMVTTTNDIFSIQGARDVYKEAATIFGAFGKPENLQMVEDDAGHASTKKNREALHAFFQQHLNNPGSPDDLKVELFDEKELWVTPEGQIQRFKPSETLFSLNSKYTEKALAGLQQEKASNPGFSKSLRSKVVELTGYKKPAVEDDYIFSGRLWRDAYSIEKYLVKASTMHYVPLLRLLPKEAQPKGVILLLDDKGKSSAVKEGLGGRLAESGYEVIIPDLSGTGELGGGYKGGDALIQGTPMNIWYAGILVHKTPLAIRMGEIGCIMDFIGHTGNKQDKTTTVACGTLTSDLLHTAIIDDRIDKIALINPLCSYLSIVQEREYRTKFIMSAVPGVIGSYDLPDLVSAITPGKVLMVNPVNALDKEVEIAGEPFKCKIPENSIFSTLISWLRFPICAQTDPNSRFYVPVKRITAKPGFHWFAYYDKLQCDPSGRYVLGMQTEFEGRSPEPGDVIGIGMVDLEDDCKWIPLGESRAWGWQQGCQLQFIPGTTDRVLWNDKEGGRFVCHIMNITTREKRTIPWPVYALSPDGKWAVTTDYRRVNDTRPGYGYSGIPDPNEEVLAPDNSGIWKIDLQTGEAKLIITLAQAAALENPYDKDFTEAKHWFNHLLVNPDGTRFIFLHRWRYADAEKNRRYGGVGGFGTRMFTSAADGSDLRVIDPYNYTSHFIWRDPSHILAWTRIPERGDGFFLFEDSPVENIVQIGKDVMKVNGHCTYLPGSTDWVLNDTYPNKDRLQCVYLYNEKTGEHIPLADFYSPPEYKGEWRCDTHPRSTPDGNFVIVDSPNRDGRQMYMLDLRNVLKNKK